MNTSDTVNVDTSDSANVDTSDFNVDTSNKLRVKIEELEIMILNLCKIDFISLDEIAKRINRKPKYLKNKIIPLLVDSGKLLRLHPTKPNHPQQAYKTAQEIS
jgi:hypothetical protein